MTSTLRTLALTILSGVDAIEGIYSQAGVPVPSLNDAFIPSPLYDDEALVNAQRLVANAAAQIIAHASQPMDSILQQVMGVYMTTSLGFVVGAHIPDILNDAGPQGLSAKDIAASAGVNAGKLARVLRFLAARHTFTEVSQNVFANNRLSSILTSKAKTPDEIKASPESEREESGIASFVAHCADEGLKSASFFPSFLLNGGPEGYESPFNVAIASKSTLWEWYAEPENVDRGKRFAAGMKGTGSAARYTSETFTTALDWAALKADSVVVDVGGGSGNVTMHLAKVFPHLKYVVQDLKSVITDTAEKLWAAERPDLIANGTVSLQVHDFFKEQPIKSATVYYMRFILHDWDDQRSIDILKKIREAAGPSSTLIVWEHFVPTACYSTDSKTDPLLHPLVMPLTWLDMHMMSMLDGQERMFSELADLGKAAGWKCEEKNLKTDKWLMTWVFSPA